MNQSNLERAKKTLRQDGWTIHQWADANQFKPQHVYDVLNGRNKGRRGTGHQIALALGLKHASHEFKRAA